MTENRDFDEEWTFIHVKKRTKRRFKNFGKMGELQDNLVNRMMDHIDKCDRWWNHE
ncbi:hypothetical protein [Nitrosopumilus sp.]|uniref:hypothetical protein n=1 Tax=Nitrosopumilus sp. TaxID=2024843 RepID=UPI00247D0033|nr:hypothetical protein [Nitrosopumilus sp.]MCV0430707.1 hypothetical protein [Nitrosopumilus sp.]